MSTLDDRRAAFRHVQIAEAIAERNQRIAECMAEAARLRGGRGALSEAKYQFWARSLEHLNPVPGQRTDTALTDVVITKGANNLTQYDVKLAIRLAKKEGIPFEKAVAAIEAINMVNTPSYRGGSLIQKTDASAERAAEFVLQHRMTGATPDFDCLVFKALYSIRQPVAPRRDAPPRSSLGWLAGRL